MINKAFTIDSGFEINGIGIPSVTTEIINYNNQDTDKFHRVFRYLGGFKFN